VELALLGGLIGGLVVLRQQPRYASTASVGGAANVALARSPRVADVVLRSPVAGGISRTSLLEHSRVTARDGTLDFRATDASPARAEAIATRYARAFADVREGRQFVVPADGAERVAPTPRRMIGIALLLGLFGGLIMAILIDALDTRVRMASEVEQALGLPLLGTPRASPWKPDSVTLRTSPYGEEAESYRILRTNLDVATVDPNTRTIMVTGALDGDGRTATAANLAVAFALEGRRVALVDLHLRYPAIARRFGLDGGPGLTDVLVGHVPLSMALARIDLQPDEAVRRPPMKPPGALDVLPAGPEPIDTSEVVGSAAVMNVVDDLRRSHELVFIDAPPLLPVSDARTLSAVADAMIVVANLRLLRRPMLGELRRAIAACTATPLGFVVTGLTATGHDPYSGYYLERRALSAAREWAA
jgi:Mrp family chromosome partitioning ATPase